MTMSRIFVGLTLCSAMVVVGDPAAAQDPAPTPKLQRPPQTLKLRNAKELQGKMKELRNKLKGPKSSPKQPQPGAKPGKGVARTLARAQARQLLRRKDPKLYAEHGRRKIKALLKRTVGDKPVTPAIRTLLRASAQRQASLDRIEDLAIKAGDETSLRRVEKLRAIETQQLGAAVKMAAESKK